MQCPIKITILVLIKVLCKVVIMEMKKYKDENRDGFVLTGSKYREELYWGEHI